jgi:hypothetical protein
MKDGKFLFHVAFLTDATGGTSLMYRDLPRNLGGKTVEMCSTVEQVIKLVSTGKADMIIVDTSHGSPVSVSVARLFQHPLCALTPTVAACATAQQAEAAAIQSVGFAAIAGKPLTGVAFKSAVRPLREFWANPALVKVRNAAKNMIEKKMETGLRSLVELNQQASVQPVVSQALAIYYMQLRNYSTAEKVLLSALKSHGANTGLLLGLASLYMSTAMPGMAKKYLVHAKKCFGEVPAVELALLQCNMMLDRFDDALKNFEMLEGTECLTRLTSDCKADVLFAEGKMTQFAALPHGNTILDSLNQLWAPPTQNDGNLAAS